MNQQASKHLLGSLLAVRQGLCRVRKESLTALSVTMCILLLRSLGFLQSSEWTALDYFFQMRPKESLQERITIVAIDEASLRNSNSWPIPDRDIAQLIKKIQQHQPRAIGLDIYRDLPVEPGHQELLDTFKSVPNLVGIELLSNNNKNTSVPPSPLLHQLNQVGFNNVVYDADGKVRRNILYWQVNEKARESFSLKLALLYLKHEGITPKNAESNPQYLQLGNATFNRFQSNDGSYVRADDGGYQIISNFPKAICSNSKDNDCHFPTVSMRDVLTKSVSESLFKDRIVLIGSTAPSVQDFVLIPYSSRLIDTAKPVAGVELQAYFVSELVSAALNGRPLLKVWSDFVEYTWIFACAYAGVIIKWGMQRTSISFLIILLSAAALTGSAYLALLFGWWIPIVPGLFALSGSAIAITYQMAYRQEELKRSKEFLHQVINAIPDPIFVKNEKHQWIVLNEAYCEFIGHPKETLLEKSDYDFFPKHEADIFRASDELIFHNQQPQESEEEFTDASGNTHVIATKRSLHKDAAGNFFLVGVIRDITKRKLIEEELRRAATELFRINQELKVKQDNLRYMAYHDPLTGLPNRKFFLEQLQESLEWAQNNNLLLGLLFIDLDGFKQINDTLGHEMGDRLLVTVAQRLNNSLRSGDTVARLGGDEFTVIVRAIPKVQAAQRVAEKILATLTEPIVLEGHITTISASIGISIYPINSLDSETLLGQADTAMYRAKLLGKNRYEFV
ncbi:CHASE2 domain-containing protein [Scytonema sp. UIC 10036]|uniref:CHASE2 domain-containing protein n=1 Tax=Scytonema sp. UIC 10036 TaxID=2304196 RepID=UPI0012DA1243|nr:CHASE2 domain-containing protein [Scytonema sp. UIC 10036]MUG97143.1 CHASE2 domain-containing protein [Scytonema sp. UIC 10036]